MNVPTAFISIVATNDSLSCGVPSRETVRPPPMPPPATFDHEREDADGARGVDGSRDVVVVVDITADRDGPVTELLREGGGPLRIAIEDRDTDAGVDETPNGRGAEPTRSAGNER